ncbi:hypothetical protein BD413DRAFT_174285 [Trametes elegans]|nr:hypothetical protein BD413DRAFT_174285 [Trametes elegans]
MKPGDSTVLTGSPPALVFTPPISIPGVDTMHVANQTSAATDIGLGYISEDMMSPVALWDKVPKGTILISGMTPILGAYIEVDGEKEEHPSSVDKLAPIWQQDLLSLGPVTTIIIMDSRDGWYSAIQYSTPEFTAFFPTVEVLNENLQVQGKIYRATLAFSDTDDIDAATSFICTQLSAQGYVPSVSIKRGDTEATLELTVPPGGSCHQAEVDLTSCFENGVCAALSPHIKGHGGEMLQDRTISGVAVWAPISPCNPEWSM